MDAFLYVLFFTIAVCILIFDQTLHACNTFTKTTKIQIKRIISLKKTMQFLPDEFVSKISMSIDKICVMQIIC